MANKHQEYSVESLMALNSNDVEMHYANVLNQTNKKSSILKNGFLIAGCLSINTVPAEAYSFLPLSFAPKFEVIVAAANDAIFETTAPDYYGGIFAKSKHYIFANALDYVKESKNKDFYLNPTSVDILEVAASAFSGSKPMAGIEYDHLDRLVHKNAHSKPIIPGML